ncbi:MAG TPA: hypothetical protein DG753_02555 [Clostridium sp.]|nr:hypothetical protein [Clostridium sp.]
MDDKNIIIKQLCCEKSINLIKKFNITSLILFGSYNSNEYNESSDVDIAVIAEKKIDFDDIIELELYFETFLKKEIDLVDLKSDNLDLFLKIDILNSGTILYSNDRNFTFELYKKHIEWIFNENKDYMFFRRRDVLS